MNFNGSQTQQQLLALPAPVNENYQILQPIQQQSLSLTMDEQSKHDAALARSYNELLDVYSLHQFIIRKGKVLD